MRLATTVREVHASGDGWRLVTGPVPDPAEVEVDGVVFATPAAPTARFLADIAPIAAELLAALEYASMGKVMSSGQAAPRRP